MQLLITTAVNREQAVAQRAGWKAALPQDPVVVFLRRLPNGSTFRAVTTRGIWTPSARGALDTPLYERARAGGIYDAELAGRDTVAKLVAYLTTLPK